MSICANQYRVSTIPTRVPERLGSRGKLSVKSGLPFTSVASRVGHQSVSLQFRLETHEPLRWGFTTWTPFNGANAAALA